eukprot:CAMPEP_0203748108 /NCGR_PEP_ID=MMETSP0098-20131031/3067_1 /ASSEMBLY_ACC=CAM_ASM_000208 /TAXON_ID=96639 /ORGANISM=" , Strain NY0313808BC1" /LENGTH=613 /DNA_ID=CAMNT_0050636729 /DNA_START=150 /DNA_END=1991 /DNA_ORIENTATION=-
MDSYFDKARDFYNQAVKAVSKTETEKKLGEALSNENWGASTTLLREIANLTHDWAEYSVVMREVFGTLQLPPKCWRQIFKALTLLEYLVKNGAEKCVQEARDRVHQVRTLTGFSYYYEGGEKGTGVREKAKQLVELLGDSDMIKDERDKAKELRDKYTGIGRDGQIRGSTPPSRMGGFEGGSMGRYNDETPSGGFDDEFSSKKGKDKKKKKKKDKEKKKKADLDLSDDEDFGFGDEDKKGGDPFGGDDDFGKFEDAGDDFGKFDDDDDFGGFDDDSKKKSSKKKKSKKKEKKGKKKNDEDDLFGGGDATPAQGGESSETFDPFGTMGGGAAAAAGGASDNWSGFESAPAQKAPAVSVRKLSNASGGDDFGFGDFAEPASSQQKPATGDTDLFGDFSGMAGNNHSRNSSGNTGGVDFFGNQPAQHSMPAPSQPVMQSQQPMNMMQPQQQMNMMQPQQHMMQQQQPMNTMKQTQAKSSDPWAGLVDLGSLSLNDTKRAASSSAGTQSPGMSLQQRKSSTGSVGSSGGMMMMGQPPAQQNMMGGGMQPMMQPQGNMMMGGGMQQPQGNMMMGGMQQPQGNMMMGGMQQPQGNMMMGGMQQQQQQQNSNNNNNDLLF